MEKMGVKDYFKIDPTLRIIIIVIAVFLMYVVLPQFYDSMNELGKAIMSMRLFILIIMFLALIFAGIEIDINKRSET